MSALCQAIHVLVQVKKKTHHVMRINNDGGYECECSDGYKIYEKKICIGKLCRILSIKSLGQCYKYVTKQK